MARPQVHPTDTMLDLLLEDGSSSATIEAIATSSGAPTGSRGPLSVETSGPRWRLSAVEAAQLQEAQMLVHARAPLSPIGRRRVVDRVVVEGWSVTDAAAAAGVTDRTVFRWLARFRIDGQDGLVDRRPVPRRVPNRTPSCRVS